MKRAAHVVAFVFPLGFNLVKTSYDGRWNMDTLQDCSPCREEREAAGKCAEQKNKRQVCRVRHIQVTDTNSEDLWWTHEERQDRSTSASQCCLILTAVKSEVWTQCLFSQKVSNF